MNKLKTFAIAALSIPFCLSANAAITNEGADRPEQKKEQIETKAPVGKIMYVVDNGYYYLRSSPKMSVAQKGSVNAGDPVRVLEQTNGFSLIEDLKGRQKWIETKNLQENESYKVQVGNLQRINADLNHKLANIDTEQAKELKALKVKYENLLSDNTAAHKTIEEQKAKISKLSEENAELTNQVDNSEQQVQTHWAKVGATLIGIGVILGLILVYIPKPHRRRKDIW